jgi:hypothetical protein
MYADAEYLPAGRFITDLSSVRDPRHTSITLSVVELCDEQAAEALDHSANDHIST